MGSKGQQGMEVEKVRTQQEIIGDILKETPSSVFASVMYSGPAKIKHNAAGYARVYLSDDGADDPVIDLFDDDDRQRQATGRLMELLRELAPAVGVR